MYVYIITNNVNGKKYIGLSINKKPSFRESYFGSGKLIKQAIQKYGKNNFSKEILRDFDNEDDARQFEKKLIEGNDAVRSPMFYNLAGGGYGGACVGRIVSKTTKEKISKSLSGRKRPPEVIDKVSKKLRGRKQDKAVIAKRAIGIKIAWREMSDSTKKLRSSKISKAHKGKNVASTTRTKLSQANAKLTKEQVLDIFSMRKSGLSLNAIKHKYGIGTSSISEILNKKTYCWVWQ